MLPLYPFTPLKLAILYSFAISAIVNLSFLSFNIYGANEIEVSEQAQKDIENIENLGYGKLPICFAKTPLSFSDNAKKIKIDEPFKIYVREIRLKAGAGFIVIIAGKIMTMPGLPKVPSAEKIDINENGDIVGLF